MEFFKSFDWSWRSIGKVAGIAFFGIVLLSVAVSLFSFSIRTLFSGNEYGHNRGGMGMVASDAMMSKETFLPPIPSQNWVDQNAESFEVKSMQFSYQTHKKEEICAEIFTLKQRPDLIFTSSNESDTNCSASFQVEKEKEAEITAILEALTPESRSQSIETIQKTVLDLEDQVSITKKRLESIESTLTDAQKSYDELMALATRKENVDALAKLIDTKLNTINKLSEERTTINNQLSEFAKQQTEMLERLKYTTFSVSVFQDLFIDWDEIATSWKEQVQQLFRDINEVLQAISVNLLSFAVRAVQGVVYLAVAVGLLRFVWAMTKRIWTYGRK